MVNKLAIGTFVVFFIGVIVVLALFPEIAKNVSELKDLQTVVNETITITRNHVSPEDNVNETYIKYIAKIPSTTWDRDNCPISNFAILNASGTPLTSGTDYTFNEPYGNITFKNTSALIWSRENTTLANYNWCGIGYVPDSAGRSVAGMILIFAALGLVGFAIWAALHEAGWLQR